MYAYAHFTKDSYEYFVDESPLPLSDSGHMNLFNFINLDLSCIKPFVDGFLAEQFDFERMRLRNDRPAVVYNDDYRQVSLTNSIVDMSEYAEPNKFIQGLIKTLRTIHPFYTMGFNDEMEAKSIIVNGFNARASQYEYFMDKKEYGDVIVELLSVPPFITVGNPQLEFIYNGKIDVGKYYKEYWDTNEKFSSLRRMKKKGVFFSPPLFGIFETQRTILDLFIDLLDTASTGKRRKNPYSCKFTIALTVSVIDGKVYEEYSIENLQQLLECEIYRMAIEKINVKICKCCDAYFVNSDKRTQYCNRKIEGDKTCREIGPNKIYWKNKKTDEKFKSFRKASSKNMMRLSRNNITSAEYEYWQEQAVIKRESGSDDFYEWLDMAIDGIKNAYKSK